MRDAKASSSLQPPVPVASGKVSFLFPGRRVRAFAYPTKKLHYHRRHALWLVCLTHRKQTSRCTALDFGNLRRIITAQLHRLSHIRVLLLRTRSHRISVRMRRAGLIQCTASRANPIEFKQTARLRPTPTAFILLRVITNEGCASNLLAIQGTNLHQPA